MAITKVWLDESENLPATCVVCEAFASEHDIPLVPDMGTGTVHYQTQDKAQTENGDKQ